MAKEATELKQTKNAFKFIGKVSRIDKDGAYKEETATRGKREGDTYRSLRFGVKTSPNNEMTVSMYDFEPEKVFLWNSEKRKADQNYKGEKMDYSEWVEKQEELREEGTAVLQTRVGLTYGEDGKLQSKGLPSFVASKEIFNNLDNGDSVVIEGEIRYSEYEGQDGKMKKQTTYTIKKAYKIKDIDFEDEKFEEVTYFEQEFVYVGAEIDKEAKKVFVTGRTIDYNKNFFDSEFVVDFSDGEGGNDAGMVKLADAFLKKMKFGDVLTVFGDALNKVIVEEVEDEEDDKDDYATLLGGKKKPKHAQKFAQRTYISEMQIHGVEDWQKKVYKESDFVKDELIKKDEDKKNPFTEELGGKSKKKGKVDEDPFASDNDIDIDDSDLPF